jgi:hypothetical protein
MLSIQAGPMAFGLKKLCFELEEHKDVFFFFLKRKKKKHKDVEMPHRLAD